MLCRGNITTANTYKRSRYRVLAELIRSSGWSVRTMPVEAGARGFVAHSFFHALRSLGFAAPECRQICKTISAVVARCSYAIWLARHTKQWPLPALVTQDAHLC